MGGFMRIRTIITAATALIFVGLGAGTFADTWKPIRSGSSGSGWQKVVCDRSGGGWRSCNMGLTITVQAYPNTLAAVGEQGTVVANVTDYDGNNAGANVAIRWATSDGTLSATDTKTDANGQASVVLTSSHTIGGATVTATSTEEGGAGQVFVPFSDRWAPASAVYTGWQNSSDPYSCSAWSPDPSTVAAGTTFTQSATCSQNQIAYQQNREVSLITGQVRNSGAPIPLYQTIQVTITQQATGTKQSQPTCKWTAFTKEGIYATVWSHLVSNVDEDMTYGFLLYLGNGGTGVSVTNKTDTATYNGRIYSVGRFRQSTCLGKNCAQNREEYEVCSVPE
ncbi:Ig-like domain-containing protein [Pseudomonas nitroreducens]|uniref:Big-1 domain-containing protein n=2 Tax=Pseudomonas TaxID=286 RepID=A0A6G6J8C7_PSENT|nr:Ig-like domain-containing protein [Pseudomonas nitroreducens]QIE91463.1 hypothetical protein G5B91_34595 [Pseudomonas nitroreducens]HBO6305045.1 hypothetical protein [Pseudomonas aeruginosa]